LLYILSILVCAHLLLVCCSSAARLLLILLLILCGRRLISVVFQDRYKRKPAARLDAQFFHVPEGFEHSPHGVRRFIRFSDSWVECLVEGKPASYKLAAFHLNRLGHAIDFYPSVLMVRQQ